MKPTKEKFATQAAPEVLAKLREIAANEGRQLQAVLDEALRDYIEKKRTDKPRAHVLKALGDSLDDFDELYKALAK